MARPPKLAADLRNIAVRPDGKHRIDVVRVLPDGQRFRRTTVLKDQADAIAYRDEALAEYNRLCNGASALSDNHFTVGEWCDHCLTTIMPTQGSRRGAAYTANTLAGYQQLVDCYVKPLLGDVRLTRLGSDHLDALVGSLTSESVRIKVKHTLSRILEIAELKGKRAKGSNPCKMITIGRTKNQRTSGDLKIKRKVKVSGEGPSARYRIEEEDVPSGLQIESRRVLSFEEETVLIEHVRKSRPHADYLTPILLGLRSGLRIAESLGLDWSAVDFERNIISVDQQAQRVTGKGYQAVNPKSQAGFREIPMTKSLAEHLRGLKLLSNSPHVVPNERGDRRDAARAHARFKELCEGCGLGDKVVGRRFVPRPTFHDLRRTCLTRLATGYVAEGVKVTPVPPTVLIKISGHEDVQTLLDFYTTADDSMVKDAMSNLP